MLGALTEKFQKVFAKLSGSGTLTDGAIADAVQEVRQALLEADVNYGVVKTLVQRVQDKAIGEAKVKGVSSGQQFIKIVHDELVALMGGQEVELDLSHKPSVILMCGLQGSGKTTHSAKLAKLMLRQQKAKKPLLVACDLQRPAAIQQLKVLGAQAGVAVFSIDGEKDPVKVAEAAIAHAKKEGFDVVIVDTAGRLHIDEELMKQLEAVKAVTAPHEVLFVANATTGQDAVNVAMEFNNRVAITGTILSMLDGNTRGGAAISIREVTGKPLKFEGIGEKLDDIQVFNPQSMADRILGMGDTINLVRKAQEHISEDEAKKLEDKIRSATFTYNDYLKQMQTMKKMGSLSGLLGMLPGMSQMKDLKIDEKEITKVEAIIYSMTSRERIEKDELLPSRRKRIAKGSGTHVDDVNRLIKSFKQARQFFRNMPNSNSNMLEKMMGGKALWR